MTKYYIEKATNQLFYVLYESNGNVNLVNEDKKYLTIRKCMINKWFIEY